MFKLIVLVWVILGLSSCSSAEVEVIHGQNKTVGQADAELDYIASEEYLDTIGQSTEELIDILKETIDSLDLEIANYIAKFYEYEEIGELARNRGRISLESEVLRRSISKFEMAVENGGIADDTTHANLVIWTEELVISFSEIVELDSSMNEIVELIRYPNYKEDSKSKYLVECKELRLSILQLQSRALRIILDDISIIMKGKLPS